METYYWLIAVVILLIIELITVGLTTVWFAAGALLAFFSSLFGAGGVLQFIIFTVSSVLLLVLTRPIAVKHLNNGRVKTNYEGLIGESVRVTERIDNFSQTGAVLADGKEWTARTEDDSVIEKDGRAVVLAVEGVKLIVKAEA